MLIILVPTQSSWVYSLDQSKLCRNKSSCNLNDQKLSSLYISVCSITCSRLILHLMESSKGNSGCRCVEEGKHLRARGEVGDQIGVQLQGDEETMSIQPEFGTVLEFSALMTVLE